MYMHHKTMIFWHSIDSAGFILCFFFCPIPLNIILTKFFHFYVILLSRYFILFKPFSSRYHWWRTHCRENWTHTHSDTHDLRLIAKFRIAVDGWEVVLFTLRDWGRGEQKKGSLTEIFVWLKRLFLIDRVMEEVKRRRAESVWLHMKESERKVFHIRWLWEREMTTNVIGGDSNDRDDNNYCRFVNWKCLQSMPHWCYDIVGNSQHFSMWLLGASLIAAFRRFILESL